MGVMQLVVMPMFFISGALFPVTDLPGWLAFLNRLDPLTYAVDADAHASSSPTSTSARRRKQRSTPASPGSAGPCPSRWRSSPSSRSG